MVVLETLVSTIRFVDSRNAWINSESPFKHPNCSLTLEKLSFNVVDLKVFHLSLWHIHSLEKSSDVPFVFWVLKPNLKYLVFFYFFKVKLSDRHPHFLGQLVSLSGALYSTADVVFPFERAK